MEQIFLQSTTVDDLLKHIRPRQSFLDIQPGNFAPTDYLIYPNNLQWPFPFHVWSRKGYYGEFVLREEKLLVYEEMRNTLNGLELLISVKRKSERLGVLKHNRGFYERWLDQYINKDTHPSNKERPIDQLCTQIAIRVRDNQQWTLQDVKEDFCCFLDQSLHFLKKNRYDHIETVDLGSSANDGICFGNTLTSLTNWIMSQLEKQLIENVYLPIYLIKIIKQKEEELREFEEQVIEEEMPDFEFSGAPQQMAWLHELGILELIKEKCTTTVVTKLGVRKVETNWSRVANIISSFTGMNVKNDIKQPLSALMVSKDTTSKHHPLKSEKNVAWLAKMKRDFKIDQE